MEDLFNIRANTWEVIMNAEEKVKANFENIENIAQYNQYKVIKAMQESRLADIHFNSSSGYGYNDIGRDKIEEIYSKVFSTEDSIVRTQIVSGTHALSLMLTGILRPNDLLLSVSSKPYDTLDDVIGINGTNGSSLRDYFVDYDQVDLNEGGDFDYSEIELKIKSRKPKVVYIQRSGGYSFRKALSINQIDKLCSMVKAIDESIIIALDNCYGEFLDYKEPTEVGVDIMAGSLIKNPGGGIALSGGYITGKKNLIDLVSYRLTTPGIGKETGISFNQNRNMLQGFFMAPSVVSSAIKGAVLCSQVFQDLGYEVSPKPNDIRSDIIQAIKFNSDKKVIDFCQGIQSAAPVDSHVIPVPWEMPGYDSNVIMAAGAFVQGSSIELSADSPIKEPYIAYFQGGLTYFHSKLGVAMGLEKVLW
jgi:cystathionine beta-lyase family protein involved in aluminum resistance